MDQWGDRTQITALEDGLDRQLVDILTDETRLTQAIHKLEPLIKLSTSIKGSWICSTPTTFPPNSLFAWQHLFHALRAHNNYSNWFLRPHSSRLGVRRAMCSYNYLMKLERKKLVIDGTRGDTASCISHSCTPNCIVTIWPVLGMPRIGIFAGSQGVQAGVEVTIDYEFMPFPTEQIQACYCCSKGCRRYVGPKKNKNLLMPIKE